MNMKVLTCVWDMKTPGVWGLLFKC